MAAGGRKRKAKLEDVSKAVVEKVNRKVSEQLEQERAVREQFARDPKSKRP